MADEVARRAAAARNGGGAGGGTNRPLRQGLLSRGGGQGEEPDGLKDDGVAQRQFDRCSFSIGNCVAIVDVGLAVVVLVGGAIDFYRRGSTFGA